MSGYYDTSDPDGPQALTEYHGIRPGDRVVYRNPAMRRDDGSYATGGMDDVYVVTEFVRFPDFDGDDGFVVVILNGGEWEVNADNVVPEENQDQG